jgi:hypothetical protein
MANQDASYIKKQNNKPSSFRFTSDFRINLVLLGLQFQFKPPVQRSDENKKYRLRQSPQGVS